MSNIFGRFGGIAVLACVFLVAACASSAQQRDSERADDEPKAASAGDSTESEASSDEQGDATTDDATQLLGPLAAQGEAFAAAPRLPDADPDATDRCKKARVLVEKAMGPHRAAMSISLDVEDEDQLRLRMKEKMKLAGEAQQMFDQAVQEKCPQWATASLFLMGLHYANFAEQIMETFVPVRLSQEQARTYCELLFDKAEELYQEQALPLWERSVQLGEDVGVENQWTEQARHYIEAGRFNRAAEVDACVQNRPTAQPSGR